MALFGRLGRTRQERLQAIEDMAPLAETPEEVQEMAKSVAKMAADIAKGKNVEDPDEDDNDEDAVPPSEESDNDDGDNDEDDDVPTPPASGAPPKPAGRRMTKSLADALTSGGVNPAEIDGFDVLESVGAGLLENNKTGLQTYRSVASLGPLLEKSLRMTGRLLKRVDELEAKLEARNTTDAADRELMKSISGFVDGLRHAPVGTPSADPTSPAMLLNQGALMHKSLPGGDVPAPEAKAEPDTLRGLDTMQLLKGVSGYLLDLPRGAECPFGITEAEYQKIGTVPMSRLNPHIPEVAAKKLGIALTD